MGWIETLRFYFAVMRWGVAWFASGVEDEKGRVSVMGSNEFVRRSMVALDLLSRYAPDAYELVQKNIKTIVEWRGGVGEDCYLPSKGRYWVLAGPEVQSGDAGELASYLAGVAFYVETLSSKEPNVPLSEGGAKDPTVEFLLVVRRQLRAAGVLSDVSSGESGKWKH